MEIAGFILLYLALGFITVLIGRNHMEINSGGEAVFATFIWPVLAIFGIVFIITWPIAKFYEKLFGL
ncbi:hypothetical protein MX01_85 [Escherichia phage MX01]|uniref:Uncharacterized protein n=1 Tax=Escherichia phage MX01 TaxID=1837930 RepID=A0A172Q1Y0_9CAUD|nr:hypothetical protein BOW90_gp085 [Escherichia phage MX01]AND76030.1 hypothetical protein MX01_85 [Escherichia phage MX01]